MVAGLHRPDAGDDPDPAACSATTDSARAPPAEAMSRWKIGRGSVTIEVEDGSDELLFQLAQEAAPRAVAAIERELDAIVAAARAVWPVGERGGTSLRPGDTAGGIGELARRLRERADRPHSRDLFRVTLVVMPDLVVEGTITNVAGEGTSSPDYAYKIKVGELSPWQEYIVKKVREAEDRIAEILAEEMAAALDGR